ncbi:hypothetical protein [Streptomyces sp. NPDC057293]|uniref:hypothetical protein n=1 Tax=unclassified Streptomyces TaxID=2593676 RepID=UPI00362C0BBD
MITDGFGPVAQTVAPAVKVFVRKRGSQTGPTGGQIVGMASVVWWQWGSPPDGHRYVMTNQFEIVFNPSECPDGIISRGGDSGSVVLRSGTNEAVGLSSHLAGRPSPTWEPAEGVAELTASFGRIIAGTHWGSSACTMPGQV